LRFVLDAQLPPALAVSLTEAGHRADHVLGLKLADFSDKALWDWAKSNGAAIISKDEDFLHLSVMHDDGPFIVWVRLGNCSNQHLQAWLLPRLPAIAAAASAGDKLIELL
jgi:predicted nuclease of predicted toxin-antitoxin system